MVRASVEVEKAGLPTSSIVCGGFVVQGKATAAGLGMPNLPMAVYPGHINLHSREELQKNVETGLVDQIVRSLTSAPKAEGLAPEPAPGDIVFSGTFEEVNRFFYDQEWGDGLPVVPPTPEKVREFLKYTDRQADEVIGALLPEKREATIWNIAVNGVMAGCRPEYMPVLIAMVEAMADPKFGQEHLGHTPGTETLVIINGPIIKALGFNYEQGALRVGFQANTSVGRFWRLYLRNVAGFLPHKTDKATFGGTWRVVLAENEDALAGMGWPPLSADQGFAAGDNVVTITSCTATDLIFSIGASDARKILDTVAARLTDIQLQLFYLSISGPSVRPIVAISPCLAEAIAKNGFTKSETKRYLYEQARFVAKRFEEPFIHTGALCRAVAKGKLPAQYCQSTDDGRLVPLVWSPDDFLIVVSGDPDKDNCLVGAQNGFIGYPVSKKIKLPANWGQLLNEAKQK
ncbi:MAG: hypothetical protein HY668_01500 [Chloroflexi bacterium]|nr:hypothetical protein [Chloroflexota bacterium]